MSGFSTPLVHSPRSNQGPYPYRTGMGLIPSAEWNVFYDNFNTFIVSTAITNGPPANTPWGWTGAVIDTGATIVADSTVTHPGGGLLFDSDGTTEGASIYLAKTQILLPTKRTLIEMRFKTEAADDTDVQFGLTDLTATTNPEDLWTTTAANLVAFGVLDGSAVTKLLCDKSNAGTAAVTGTISLVTNTWHTLGIFYNGAGRISAYVDGQLSASTTTTVPESVLLAPFIGFRNGSTADNEGYCGWFRFIQEM